MSLLSLFGLDLGIQWIAFIVAFWFKTEKFYDLTGSLTFILTSHLSHSWSRNTTRQFMQSHMVMAWAIRLGLFLFIRVIKDGGDKRFDKAKTDFTTFLVFWTLQGLWVFITLLPTLLLNASEHNPPLGARDFIGWTMWLAGLTIEAMADMQKSSFKADLANKDKFISSGLWSISRHPNYFGEILLWFGLYLSASSALKGWKLFSVLSPVAVYLLITKVSGIPILERNGLKKFGHLPEYKNYLRSTPELIPFTQK